MTSRSMTTWPCRLLMLALLCVVSVGCGGPRGGPVDSSKAQDVFKTFLKAWQDGKKAEDLKPGITGVDRDWSAGKKLISYEIKPNENNQGTTLRFSVQLTLKDDKGAESKSTAIYNVTTAPAVTVIRDDDG